MTNIILSSFELERTPEAVAVSGYMAGVAGQVLTKLFTGSGQDICKVTALPVSLNKLDALSKGDPLG